MLYLMENRKVGFVLEIHMSAVGSGWLEVLKGTNIFASIGRRLGVLTNAPPLYPMYLLVTECGMVCQKITKNPSGLIYIPRCSYQLMAHFREARRCKPKTIIDEINY